jgi:hypothetical protein
VSVVLCLDMDISNPFVKIFMIFELFLLVFYHEISNTIVVSGITIRIKLSTDQYMYYIKYICDIRNIIYENNQHESNQSAKREKRKK